MRLTSFAAAFVFAGLAMAAPTPMLESDIAGSSDLDWLKRYEGSVIAWFKQEEFGEFDFPAGELKPQPGQDSANNSLRVPEQTITLRGKLTRFIYVLPEGRSPLEAVAGYQEELSGKDGETLYECKERGCGGAVGRSITSGGGEQGLQNYLIAREEVPEQLFSIGWCAMQNSLNGQRYALVRADTGTAGVHVGIYAAVVEASGDCGALNKRTVAIVTVLEDKPREQRMETVSAEQMNGDIMQGGRAVLYGIYFDTDKATLKPESKPQMDEIAAFLKANEGQEFLVVGHTDNQGQLPYNQDLSQRRAAAVTAALTKEYGIPAKQLTPLGVGMAAPVAPNTDETGRAKNRRVEIVAR
jgi:outer membrane protein OmpA-like peptidoglycan-associated protein